ncbi:MAG: hypothetical protein ACOVP4_11690 [Bacteriovoracaceae bacterium]
MKYFIVSIILISSFKAFSMECDPGVNLSENIEDLIEVATDKRDWWAASKEKIAKAPCRKNYPTLAEQEKYLQKISVTPPSRQKKINGVELDDSPAMIALFKDLTTFEDFSEPTPPELKELGLKYKIGSDCKKVECALGKMFGSKQAKEMLYMKQRFGLNTSPLIRADMQQFSEKEMQNVQKALMDFPSHFLPLDENRQCTRLHKERSLGLGTLANATITFANEWTKYDPEIMQSTVFHELSHNVGSVKDLDNSKEWLEASGWEKRGDDWVALKDNFVSNYAASNPQEDFAESMVAFRYDPVKLRSTAPEKYKLIKEKVFGGLEYLKPEMCLESNLKVAQAIKKIAPQLSNFDPKNINPEMRKSLVRYCRLDSVEALMDRAFLPFKDCMEGAMALELAKQQMIKDNPQMSAESVMKNFFSDVNGKSAKESFGISFSEEQKKKIADYSQNLLDEYEIAAFKDNIIYTDHKDKKSYCKDFGGEYSYQRFKKLEKDMNKEFILYDKREDFDQLMTSKCLRVQKTFPKFRPFTEKDYKLLVR